MDGKTLLCFYNTKNNLEEDFLRKENFIGNEAVIALTVDKAMTYFLHLGNCFPCIYVISDALYVLCHLNIHDMQNRFYLLKRIQIHEVVIHGHYQ